MACVRWIEDMLSMLARMQNMIIAGWWDVQRYEKRRGSKVSGAVTQMRSFPMRPAATDLGYFYKVFIINNIFFANNII